MILALGADIKNRFCLGMGDKMFFGPVLGDLNLAENDRRFKASVKALLKKNKVRPVQIAHDLHPGYFSTRFAHELFISYPRAQMKAIQHHHAHLASVLWEHDLRRPVLGVSMDGTGYGLDGQIWGGEFFLLDRGRFERLAHLKYFKMPGGEQAVKEPWRMVLSILGPKARGFLQDIPEKKQTIILEMLRKNVNCPQTSSAGRLFDAASALLGICREARYEAQGPIALEALCEPGIRETFEFGSYSQSGITIIDPTPIFSGMARDMRRKRTSQAMATKFHNSISGLTVKTVLALSRKTGIKDVVLSGGVFQNRFLLKCVLWDFSRTSLGVYRNEKLPVNDLNISIGQYHVSRATGKN